MCDRETVDANTVGEFVPWTATIVRGAIHDRIQPRYRAFHPARATKICDRAGRLCETREGGRPAHRGNRRSCRPHHRSPVVPRMEEFWGNGQPVSLCSRSSQAHKENRSRNGLPPGRCRRASNVTLCVSQVQTQAYATSVLATLRKGLTKLETAGYAASAIVLHPATEKASNWRCRAPTPSSTSRCPMTRPAVGCSVCLSWPPCGRLLESVTCWQTMRW